MEKLRDHKVFLQMLIKSNPKYRNSLLNGAPPEIITLLCEYALNILHGTVTLTQAEKTQLSRHKTSLRQMASKKVSGKLKKKVVQKGGFIPAMLKPILKAVIPLIANQIVKAI